MEQIANNLSDPSWWFTGIFFVFIGLLLTKVFFDWIPIAARNISNSIPSINREISRSVELTIARKVKQCRQYEVKVNWLIARYWSIATITTIYISFAMLAYLIYPGLHGTIRSKIVPFMLFTPAYMLQFITLWEKVKVQRVIRGRITWLRKTT